MSADLVAEFKGFLRAEALESSKLVLMVSGGVDSMVLLDVAHQCIDASKIKVLHINHGARSQAGSDATFVQNICSKYKITYSLVILAIEPQQNIEAAWREARQAAAAEIAQKFGAERILTAHHATDLTETMLFRLTKGAGPSGLSPFDVRTKPFWKRPKSDLVAYAEEHQIEWREDESNMNTKFERNLIRAQVLPALRQITPNLEKVFVREAQTFAQLDDFIHQVIENQCGDGLKAKQISLSDFNALHPTLKNQLLRSLAQNTVSEAEIQAVLNWLEGVPKGGTHKKIGAITLYLKKGVLTWD